MSNDLCCRHAYEDESDVNQCYVNTPFTVELHSLYRHLDQVLWVHTYKPTPRSVRNKPPLIHY